MNDDEMFSLVRDRMTRARDDLGSVYMEQPASAVLHRARSRSLRHRLYGAAAGTGALGVALAVGLGTAGTAGTGGTGGGTAVGTAAGTSAAKTVHVNLDAWSVNTAANGTVKLTIRLLEDKAELVKVLAAAGVPAVVSFGEICKAVDRSNPSGIENVVGFSYRQAAANHGNATINPAAIPSGDELAIGIFYGPGGKKSGPWGVGFALVLKGAALTCSAAAKFGATK